MTVQELIANVLDNLRRNFYGDARIREFMRDERQLIKAISTYGHECNLRGWNFDVDFIYQEIMQLLLKIRMSGAKIDYMPVYLGGAIRRHIGLRAEELSERAKSLTVALSKAINIAATAKAPAEMRQPTGVEVFTEMYNGIRKIERVRKGQGAAAKRVKEKQEELL